MDRPALAQYDEDLALLEAKAEDLIDRATRMGADVDFHRVRRNMAVGRRYRMPRLFDSAIADLERGIAAANREKMRRASRRPLVLNMKNLFKFW